MTPGSSRGRGGSITAVAVAVAVVASALVSCTPVAREPAVPDPAAAGQPAGSAVVPAAPPVPVFPDESTTGVPDATVLRPIDSIRITEDGFVLDSVHVNGSISVEADDVVIRRTRVDNNGLYAIRMGESHRNLLVEDSEIDGNGEGAAAVCCSDFTLRRVDIHHVFEGPRVNGDVVIVDSYIHHLLRCEDCHIDALQTTAGSNIEITGNNLQAYNPETGDQANAAYQFGSTQGAVDDVSVKGNLLNGGSYTVNGGGGGTSDSAVTFRDNRFGRDFRYGPVANLGPQVEFDSSNVWHDTGEPL